MNHIKESCHKIHRPVSSIQNYRSAQLPTHDSGWKNLTGLFEHKRLKPAVLRTNWNNVSNLMQLNQVMDLGMIESWQPKRKGDSLHM